MYRAFQCNVCATPLMSGRRIDCRYCGVRCRVKAHRIRYDGRGLLEVEFHHVVERVIKVAVPADGAQSSAQVKEEPPRASAEAAVVLNDQAATALPKSEIAQQAVEQERPPLQVSSQSAERAQGGALIPQVVSQSALPPVQRSLEKTPISVEHPPVANPATQPSLPTALAEQLPAPEPTPATRTHESASVRGALSESELRADEWKRQLREAEDKAALLTKDIALLKEQTLRQQQSLTADQELQLTRTALDAAKAKLAQRTKERDEALQAAELFGQRLDRARQKLAKREAELLQALEQIDSLSRAQQHRQSPPRMTTAPQDGYDAVIQRQRRQMAAMTEQLEGLTSKLIRAQSDQAELAQRREEVARLTTAADERRRLLLAVTSERDALQSQVASLTQQVEQLTLRLRRHDDGTYHAIASGVVGVAAGLAHAYAEKEGLNLPPLTPPAAKRAAPVQPPPAPPSPPAPPPEDAETKRWRQIIAEQKRRGWDPRADMLVFNKLDEIKAEDELARAQEKAGIPTTARKLLPSMDADFLSQWAALEARVEHHRAHCKAKSFFERARWEHEHYRLDVISESNLQMASMNRRTQLTDEMYAVRSKRR